MNKHKDLRSEVQGLKTLGRKPVCTRISAPPSTITKTHPDAGNVFEIQTMNRFIIAASSGVMPGNNKTELPLFPEEDQRYFSQPYKDWAPEPYASLPGPPGPFGAGTSVSPPPIIRIMFSMSGLDDIFTVALEQKKPKTMETSF
jgi:hypothetical protein